MEPRFHDATAADYPEFTRLFPELATGDPVPTLEHWLEDFAPSTFLVRVGGAVVGYGSYRLLSGIGYVSNVVVAPAERGKGYGRAVLEELSRRFRSRGASEWCLNVKPDNAAAIALYRSLGMRRAHESVVLRLSWDQVASLPLQSAVIGREILPEEDERVCERFKLLPGQLAETRSHANRRVVGLFAGQEPMGVAAPNLTFAPGGIGSFPFRVARVELARNLFDAVRACSGPEHVWTQAVVEDNASLADYLLRAGAAVHLRIEHYRGSLTEAAHVPRIGSSSSD